MGYVHYRSSMIRENFRALLLLMMPWMCSYPNTYASALDISLPTIVVVVLKSTCIPKMHEERNMPKEFHHTTGSLDTGHPTRTRPLTGKRRRVPWLIYLSLLGPGLVAASAGNDAGGIYTYSSMGSQFGYSMIWVMAVLMLGVAMVQEMCARMGAVTGKGLSDLIRENFPIRVTALVLLAFLLANSGVIVSEFIGIAAALRIFHVPSWISAPIAGFLLWWL